MTGVRDRINVVAAEAPARVQRRVPWSSARSALVTPQVLAALVTVFAASIAAAQQPGCELTLETQTLELGEAITVNLTCTNTAAPASPPKLTLPDGLDLKLLSSSPSASSFTQIINGRRSRRSTYTYALRLTALKAGRYTLGPITVTAGAQTYRTQPVSVVVRTTDVSSVAKADRYMFADLEVEPRSLYVTESFEATLTFGIRKVEIGGRRIDLDMLRAVLNTRKSQLSIFADGRATRSERWLTDSNGQRHRYEIYRVTKRVRADTVGRAPVGPVFLKADYPTRVRRGFFGGYEVSQHRRETARADAVTIEVKAPPEEGRPADYAGAIGRFTLSVEVKPKRVEQGQPITLSVSIRGAPLDGLAGPDLTRQPELASRFDYTPEELVGDLEGGARVYRRAIFPKQTGEQTVPPITWSFFDPAEERYRTLTSEPVSIIVDPRAPGSVGPSNFLEQVMPTADGTTLTVITGGISPNYPDAGEALANQAFTMTLPWTAALIVSPLMWLVVTLSCRHRARLETDAGFARRRRARRSALARISRALRQAEPAARIHGVTEALTRYLSDRYGLSSQTLTPGEVRSILTDKGIDAAVAGEVAEFLESCDIVRYAPGEGNSLAPATCAANVRAWIKCFEKSRT